MISQAYQVRPPSFCGTATMVHRGGTLKIDDVSFIEVVGEFVLIKKASGKVVLIPSGSIIYLELE